MSDALIKARTIFGEISDGLIEMTRNDKQWRDDGQSDKKEDKATRTETKIKTEERTKTKTKIIDTDKDKDKDEDTDSIYFIVSL